MKERSNEKLLAKNMKSTVNYGVGSVIVWGSFSASGPDVVHFIDDTIDQHIYLYKHFKSNFAIL